MFNSLFNVIGDVARVVTAPIEIAADVASIVTKPIAEIAQDVVDCVKENTDE